MYTSRIIYAYKTICHAKMKWAENQYFCIGKVKVLEKIYSLYLYNFDFFEHF